MPFFLELDGQSFRTDDLTLEEAERLEGECGRTWLELNPVRSAKEFRATARVFLTRQHAPEVAAKMVSEMTIAQATAAVKFVPEDLPEIYEDDLPKAAGDKTTSS